MDGSLGDEPKHQVTPETVACVAFFWILYLEVRGSMRRVEHVLESEYVRGPGCVAGVKVGAVL